MSPYLTEEASVESGRPIELYEFTLGSETFYYTSAAEDITLDSQLWKAILIEREELGLSDEDRRTQRSFIVNGGNEFVQRFVLSAPSEVSKLIVRRLHFGDTTDTIVIWRGEVAEFEWINNSAHCRIAARPDDGALDVKIPRMDAGVMCPYMLYDARCMVSEASFFFAGTASSVSGTSLVVSGLDAAKTVGWATAGKIRVDSTGEVRIIMAHTATDTLEIGSVWHTDPSGLAVTVLAGCDHTLATCHSKFANAINFGGNGYIPTKNPNEGIT